MKLFACPGPRPAQPSLPSCLTVTAPEATAFIDIRFPFDPRPLLLSALLGLTAGAPAHADPSASAAGDTTADATTGDDPVFSLDPLEVREEGLTTALSPLAGPAEPVFFGAEDILETPRAITVLSPEALQRWGIDGLEDLQRAGAGLSRPNFFGIAGAPFIRGTEASLFYNGNRRIQLRNTRPLPLVGTESLDIVKGPAPAHFGTANTGGYVNAQPKLPHDGPNEAGITVGSFGSVELETDLTGTTSLFGQPAAWRSAFTVREDDTHYRNIKNDALEGYFAVRAELAPGLTLTTGFEAARHRGNENVGWNRVSQNLIDNGNYVLGVANPTFGPVDGTTRNTDLPFNLSFGAATNTFDLRSALYVPATALDAGQLASFQVAPTSNANAVTVDGVTYYPYTPDYFAGGGEVITASLDSDTVLAESTDFARSQSVLWFADVENRRNPDMPVTTKFFAEYIEAEKLASYGFAEESRNVLTSVRVQAERDDAVLGIPIRSTFGGELRYRYSEFLTDFSRQPFNRRDLALSVAQPQSVVLAGPEIGWVGGRGAYSYLASAGLFAAAEAELTERFSVLFGGRIEAARFNYGVPGTFNSPFTGPDDFDKHSTRYANWMLSPRFRLARGVHLYATVQRGTTETPNSLGTFRLGEGNFNDADLYEAGIKASLLRQRLQTTAAVFYWDQTSVGESAGGEFTSALRGRGFELEVAARPLRGLTLVGNATVQEAFARGSFPFGQFRAFPLSEEQIALYGAALQYYASPEAANNPPNNPEMKLAGYPEFTANLLAVYQWQNGVGVSVGPSYRHSYYGNVERTLSYPTRVIWNGSVFFENERARLSLSVLNFTDENTFAGNEGVFSANTITTPDTPIEARVNVTLKW